METNREDKLLKDFFSENKKEIADFGFSARVMRKLPEEHDRSWIVWVFGAMGIALALLLGLQTGLIQYAFRLIQIIPQIYILISVFSFMLLGSVGVLLCGNRKCRMI